MATRYERADLEADAKYMAAADMVLSLLGGVLKERQRFSASDVDISLIALNTIADGMSDRLGFDRGRLVAAVKMKIADIKAG